MEMTKLEMVATWSAKSIANLSAFENSRSVCGICEARCEECVVTIPPVCSRCPAGYSPIGNTCSLAEPAMKSSIKMMQIRYPEMELFFLHRRTRILLPNH
jgi:hypothetical protein